MLTARSLLRIATPPYIFQPLQILKRLRLEFLWRSRREAFIALPWGLPIKIDPQESVGHNIASQGLYELGVTEALWRLTEAGDLAVDAGANIGYTSSILSVRVGPLGRVICFEPNPEVFTSLRENVEVWRKSGQCGTFDLHQAALGNEHGKARLQKRHAVRDIVFEEASPYPAPTHDYLKSLGYAIFGLAETFGGISLVLNGQSPYDPEFGPLPNYLATVDPKRALERIKPTMWRSFGPARWFIRR